MVCSWRSKSVRWTRSASASVRRCSGAIARRARRIWVLSSALVRGATASTLAGRLQGRAASVLFAGDDAVRPDRGPRPDNVGTMTERLVSVPRTAVVPAAGLGTRFLPATKTVPKELLPVVDTPGIELVASEAAQAGAERLVIVTAPGKASVVGHFVEDLVLEGKLAASGKHHLLERVRRAPGLISVEPVVQESPL